MYQNVLEKNCIHTRHARIFGHLTPNQYRTATIYDIVFVIYWALQQPKIMQNIQDRKVIE